MYASESISDSVSSVNVTTISLVRASLVLNKFSIRLRRLEGQYATKIDGPYRFKGLKIFLADELLDPVADVRKESIYGDAGPRSFIQFAQDQSIDRRSLGHHMTIKLSSGLRNIAIAPRKTT